MTSFETGVAAWIAGLGGIRDVVRQELVTRQLTAHLPPGSLRVLDAGCGQGTQAIALARRGHEVTGLDVSEELLDSARDAAAHEDGPVRRRLTFALGDVLALGDGDYDVVCCHGVAMYLPSLTDLCAGLVAAGIAMRAGMSGDWAAALAGFDATHYTNRLGVAEARADDPDSVAAAFSASGARTVAWYGVRLFTDHWPNDAPSDDLETLLDAEEQAGRRDPYRSVMALTHTLARPGTVGS